MDRSPRRMALLALLGLALAGCSNGAPAAPPPSLVSSPSPTVPAATVASSAYPATIPLPLQITVAPTPRPTPTPPRPEDWAALRRPLALPTVTAHSACQPTPGASVARHFGPALGPGPAYPIMTADGVYRYGDQQPSSEGWLSLKILWVAAPSYSGPVLIRGGQIDDPQGILLTTSATGGDYPPQEELRLFASNTSPQDGWRHWPSSTLIREPGCYTYQVDGTSFSYTIVFQAVTGAM